MMHNCPRCGVPCQCEDYMLWAECSHCGLSRPARHFLLRLRRWRGTVLLAFVLLAPQAGSTRESWPGVVSKLEETVGGQVELILDLDRRVQEQERRIQELGARVEDLEERQR